MFVSIELESRLDVLEFLVEVSLVADLMGSANKGVVDGGLNGWMVKRSLMQVPVGVGRFAVNSMVECAVLVS